MALSCGSNEPAALAYTSHWIYRLIFGWTPRAHSRPDALTAADFHNRLIQPPQPFPTPPADSTQIRH
jgi:hypothetical protein